MCFLQICRVFHLQAVAINVLAQLSQHKLPISTFLLWRPLLVKWPHGLSPELHRCKGALNPCYPTLLPKPTFLLGGAALTYASQAVAARPPPWQQPKQARADGLPAQPLRWRARGNPSWDSKSCQHCSWKKLVPEVKTLVCPKSTWQQSPRLTASAPERILVAGNSIESSDPWLQVLQLVSWEIGVKSEPDIFVAQNCQFAGSRQVVAREKRWRKKWDKENPGKSWHRKSCITSDSSGCPRNKHGSD